MRRRIAALILISSIMLFSASAVFAKGVDIIRLSDDIEISKDMIVGNVIAIGGNVVVYGRVENSVIAVGGSVTLKPKSYVGEQVVVVGGDLIKDLSAQIGGKATQVYMPRFIPSLTTILGGSWLALWATISVLVLLGFLGLAVLLAALIPDQIATAVGMLEKSFVVMFFWGLLWMILIVPIAILLAISIIGIILIPIEILLAGLGLILGYVSAAIFIGKNMLLRFKKISPPFVDIMLGILILFLIGFIPIIGPAVKALFLISGFGAVLTTRFGTIK